MHIPLIARRSGAGSKQRTRGQSLVEFALVLPVFVLLLATALDLGRVFYAQISLANAAREAAFQAAETPTSFQANTACPAAPASPDNNLVMCRALFEAQGSFTTVSPADVTLACSPSCTAAQGNTATVTVQGQFQFVTPILAPFFGGTQTLTLASTATAQMLVMPTRPPMVTITPSPSPSPTASPTASPSPSPTGPTPTPDPNATASPSPSPSPSPTPACFTHDGVAGVFPPNVIGLSPAVANDRIRAKGLTPVGFSDLRTGPKGVVQEQNPDQTVCVDPLNAQTSKVEFHFRPS